MPAPSPLAQRRWIGAMCLLGALCLAALATRLLPVGSELRPFQRAMASMGGGILLLIGIQAMRVNPEDGRLSAVVGALILTLIGAVQVAIVLYAPAEGLGGRFGIGGLVIPIGSRDFIRWGWALTATVTLALAIRAWKGVFTSTRRS